MECRVRCDIHDFIGLIFGNQPWPTSFRIGDLAWFDGFCDLEFWMSRMSHLRAHESYARANLA